MGWGKSFGMVSTLASSKPEDRPTDRGHVTSFLKTPQRGFWEPAHAGCPVGEGAEGPEKGGWRGGCFDRGFSAASQPEWGLPQSAERSRVPLSAALWPAAHPAPPFSGTHNDRGRPFCLCGANLLVAIAPSHRGAQKCHFEPIVPLCTT